MVVLPDPLHGLFLLSVSSAALLGSLLDLGLVNGTLQIGANSQSVIETQEPYAHVTDVTASTSSVPVVVQLGEAAINQDTTVVVLEAVIVVTGQDAGIAVSGGGNSFEPVLGGGLSVAEGDALEQVLKTRCDQVLAELTFSLGTTNAENLATRSVASQLDLGMIKSQYLCSRY